MLRIIRPRKQAKFQWSDIRPADIRNKKRKYLATDRKNKNIRGLNRGIHEFKRATNLELI
jgi:hypothetical protein